MSYHSELCRAMAWLSERPNAIFLGQAVRDPGTAMHTTLSGVPMEKRVEMPVAENMQMGMCTGLALAGFLPICIFPRINFLLEAISQLVQHLDKLPLYSDGGYRPRVIIRTAVAHDQPMNPGEQHLGDYSSALVLMLKTVYIDCLNRAEEIMPAYRAAVDREGSTILVEYLKHYDP